MQANGDRKKYTESKGINKGDWRDLDRYVDSEVYYGFVLL